MITGWAGTSRGRWRTRSGRFGLDQARSLEDLAEQPQLSYTPDAACLQAFSRRELSPDEAEAAGHGRALTPAGMCEISRNLIGHNDDSWQYPLGMGTKAERRASRERVGAYHEAQLAELIAHITAAVDRYRAGEIDAFDVDEAMHHYHRAARELWRFCWLGGGGTNIEIAAHVLDRMATDGETIDWWEQVKPRGRS